MGQQEKYLQSYLDDQQFLHHTGLFVLKKIGQNDAGAFLNSKVYWAPVAAGEQITKQPLVPVDVRETLLRFRGDWLKKFDRVRHMKGDLSIFTSLQRFDYWDIEQQSPIEALIKNHHFVPPPRLPLPDASDLLAVTQMRLMWGAANGEFVAALSDVRQFAQLLMSTQHTQLFLAGLMALDFERAAYRYYVEELKMDPTLWVPYDHNITRRAHRAILATQSFLQLWTQKDTFEAHLGVTLWPISNSAGALHGRLF